MRHLVAIAAIASIALLSGCGGDSREVADGDPHGSPAGTTTEDGVSTLEEASVIGRNQPVSGEDADSEPPQAALESPTGGHTEAWPVEGWLAFAHVSSAGVAAPPPERGLSARVVGREDAPIGALAPPAQDDTDDASAAAEDGASISALTVTGTPVYRVPAGETVVSINTATNTPTPTRTFTPTATRTPSPTPTRTPTTVPGSAPIVGGCQVLPSNNPWNTDISNYPVHPNSANFIASINAGGRNKLHPDWGGNGEYGIPYIVVPANQPMVNVTWTAYGDESDPGPYPIPLNAPIEGGASSDGDRHVLVVRQGECVLYELYRAFPGSNAWNADSGARWPLNSNAMRPLGWTSADAAGLPILPGLVRYDEVAAGQINHALRFTVWRSQRGYILPATHFASSHTDPNLPPMGLRLRIRASFDISGYTGQTRVVLEALKKYGMINADNGSSWFITGAADPRWDDEDLNQLKNVPSSAFEVVYTGEVLD